MLAAARWLVVALVVLVAFPAATGLAQVKLPEFQSGEPIEISAEAGNHWTQGNSEVWILRGNVHIQQGRAFAQAREGVLWITKVDPLSVQPQKVTAYLEGEVTVDLQREETKVHLVDKAWLGRFQTRTTINFRVPAVAGEPVTSPALYERAEAAREPEAPGLIQRSSPFGVPLATPVPLPATAPGSRRVRVFPRSDAPVQFQWFSDPATHQWIAVIDSGVNIIVDGLPPKFANMGGQQPITSIDVSTDRLVIWTTAPQEPNLGQTQQPPDTPLEFYMEGNIVFREGERIIYSDRMYYDIRRRVGTILNAEILTPVKKYQGLVRLRSQLVEQLNPDEFYAQNAYFTSSRMGFPSYRLQLDDMTLKDVQTTPVDPVTGQPAIDPETHQPVVEHDRLATGRNAWLYVDQFPVFYWPWMAMDLNDPTYYIRKLGAGYDTIFGTQVNVALDVFQILGIRKKPNGTDWTVALDYMGKRGYGHGTTFTYERENLFGVPGGKSTGLIEYWGILDHGGIDDLGGDRITDPIPPDKDYRYRLLWQHREPLPYDLELTAELGWISDRNFLDQYFLHEWNESKDETTDLQLKQRRGDTSWSITAGERVNDFFDQTDWLPRLDHYWLGQSLLGNRLSWFEHSTASYAHAEIATRPEYLASDPVDFETFGYYPWEKDSAGSRFTTRQEIDYPIPLGPVKVVPYAEGELGYWGEDLAGNSLSRAYGQVGLRASIPIWTSTPDVESMLWNVHGLAHKVVFQADLAFADANQPVSALPLYDPIDDNNIQQFRTRLAFNTFGYLNPLVTNPLSPVPTLLLPPQYDPRYYALRTGLADAVTSPSSELAGQMETLRLGIDQRWQTKRGPQGDQHIIDWIQLTTDVTLFPDPDRDDFGRVAGLLDYNFHWHVGDRLSVLSDGEFDFFPGGQKIVSLGGFLSRPPRGSLYLGINQLSGPFNSTVVTASYSYWMSPKWISSVGTSTDLAQKANIGQSVEITRVGESSLISFRLGVDAIRGTVGASVLVEPRFLPKGKLGNVGGAKIPVAGAYGLE